MFVGNVFENYSQYQISVSWTCSTFFPHYMYLFLYFTTLNQIKVAYNKIKTQNTVKFVDDLRMRLIVILLPLALAAPQGNLQEKPMIQGFP